MNHWSFGAFGVRDWHRLVLRQLNHRNLLGVALLSEHVQHQVGVRLLQHFLQVDLLLRLELLLIALFLNFSLLSCRRSLSFFRAT